MYEGSQKGPYGSDGRFESKVKRVPIACRVQLGRVHGRHRGYGGCAGCGGCGGRMRRGHCRSAKSLAR